MALIKRDKIWHVVFTAPDGRRIRRSSGTGNKTEAREFHDKLKVELWRVAKLGERPEYFWNDAAVRWIKETSHKATHSEDLRQFRWLDAYLRDKKLIDVTKDVVDMIRDSKQAEGVANSTVNRTMALVRSVLRRACYEWEWLERVPRVRMLPEPRRRIRWLTRAEAAQLLDELPPHLNAMMRFSLVTGLRQANVKQWGWRGHKLTLTETWHGFIRIRQSLERQLLYH